MPGSIDHIVVAVHNLDKTIEDYKRLGFNVFFGGDHKHRGSHNALVTFQDGSYIEIIAFKHEPLVKDNNWWDLLQEGEGFVDFALVVDDVEPESTRLRQQNIQVDNVFTGGRSTSDGNQIAWRLVRVSDAPGVPFLIDDVTDRTLRVPQGERAIHENGVLGVSSVRIVLGESLSSRSALSAILGGEGPTFKLKDQTIELETETVGRPGIVEVTLHGSPKPGEILSRDLTHGAVFVLG